MFILIDLRNKNIKQSYYEFKLITQLILTNSKNIEFLHFFKSPQTKDTALRDF